MMGGVFIQIYIPGMRHSLHFTVVFHRYIQSVSVESCPNNSGHRLQISQPSIYTLSRQWLKNQGQQESQLALLRKWFLTTHKSMLTHEPHYLSLHVYLSQECFQKPFGLKLIGLLHTLAEKVLNFLTKLLIQNGFHLKKWLTQLLADNEECGFKDPQKRITSLHHYKRVITACSQTCKEWKNYHM